MNKDITEKSWDEFRKSGMLWFINRTLHIFGWAIVVEIDDDNKVTGVYPARVIFRGFDEQTENDGFLKISEYMAENSPELLKEAQDE